MPQLGRWQFDAVPADPAQLLYPDFGEPISFVAPDAPAATPAAELR
jgi:hypothetical protein